MDALNGSATSTRRRPTWRKWASGVFFVVLVLATAELYALLRTADYINDPEDVGDFLTSYPGMGMLLCLIIGLTGRTIVRFLAGALRVLPFPGPAYFLATREAMFNIRVTRSLVTSISLAAVAVGSITTWIDKLFSLLGDVEESSVSAPPEQVILLLWGGVLAGCVAAASLSFSTLEQRRRDVSLLLASGYTSAGVYAKTLWECALYLTMTLVISYGAILINEVGMVWALRGGAVPDIEFSWPGWQGPIVAVLGIALSSVVLLAITANALYRSNRVSTGSKA